jgi:hypothetical protein
MCWQPPLYRALYHKIKESSIKGFRWMPQSPSIWTLNTMWAIHIPIPYLRPCNYISSLHHLQTLKYRVAVSKQYSAVVITKYVKTSNTFQNFLRCWTVRVIARPETHFAIKRSSKLYILCQPSIPHYLNILRYLQVTSTRILVEMIETWCISWHSDPPRHPIPPGEGTTLCLPPQCVIP